MSQKQHQLAEHERMGIQIAINAKLRAKRQLDASAAGKHHRECEAALAAVVASTLKAKGIPPAAELQRDEKGRFTGGIAWEEPSPPPADKTGPELEHVDEGLADPSPVDGGQE